VWAGESQSDVEAELELEEPTEMGGDASTSEDDEDRGVVATSVECRAPMAMSASGGRDAERRGDIPASRKCVVSSDAAAEQEVKRARSSRPLEVSLALPPAPSMAGHAS